MAINKKLIHFKTKQKFNEELANGNILETSIVFILDTTEIYTHGLLYDGSTFDPSDIEASILNIIDNYSTIESKIEQLNAVLLSNKQDKLVSGSNIKTINGESILGEGDIAISGAYAEVNHGTGDTTFTLTPNTLHVWDEVASLDLSLGNEVENIANEYIFQFDSGLSTSLALPDNIVWYNNTPPIINSYKTYLFSILNNYGCFLEFDTVPINVITVEYEESHIYAYSTYPIKTNIYIHIDNGSILLLVKDQDNWDLGETSLAVGDYYITLSFNSQYNDTNIIKDDYYCYSLEQSILKIRPTD